MDYEFKSKKQHFLKQKKEEKQERELFRQQLKSASKIWLFYKNQQICTQKLSELIQSILPKIETLLSIQKIQEKYNYACNIALIKYPEFLKPMTLLNEKNAIQYQYYIVCITKILCGAFQNDKSNNNFIQLVFREKNKMITKLHLIKSIKLAICLQNQEVMLYLDQIFLRIQILLEQNEQCKFKSMLEYIIDHLENIGPNKIVMNYQGQGWIYFYNEYVRNANLVNQDMCDLAFNLFINQICRNKEILYLMSNSKIYVKLRNEKLLSQNDLKLAENIYSNLQLLIINGICIDDIIYLLANEILKIMELGFLRLFMSSDYKYVQQSDNVERGMKNIRKKKEYKLFLDQLNTANWIQEIRCNEMNQIYGLSQLLYTFLQIGHQIKIELKIQLLKSKDLLILYDRIFSSNQKTICQMEFLYIHSYLKMIVMEYMDDEEFKLYVNNSQPKIQDILEFYLQYVKNQILNNFNEVSYKHFGTFLREVFERNARIKFYEWQTQDQGITAQMIKHIPFIISFPVRIENFNEYLENDKSHQNRNIQEMYMMDDDGELQVKEDRIINIIRGQEWFDAYQQLQNENMKKRYHVKFYNQMGMEEIGIDAGGVTKEFLIRVVNQVFDKNLNLFKELSDRSMIPNGDNLIDLNKYKFVGKLIGKAIYEGILIEVVLNPIFLNQVLGIRNRFNDFRYYDLQEYQSICKVKKEDVSNYGLTFSIITEDQREIDLIPNGRNIAVTNENKQYFLRLMIDYKLNKQIQKQSEAFRIGLESMIDPIKLRMFSNEELQLLISGKPTIDIVDLAQNTYYKGYKPYDSTIKDFWEVLDSLTYEEQGQFLFFVSSCSRAPTQGFKSLDPPFLIQKVEILQQADLMKLPTASTCFNILKLPNYKNKQLLKQKLLQAIHSNTGFELT